MERTVLITTSLCKTAHLGRIASHYEFAPHRELRWRPPESYGRWQGILKAGEFGPHCPQPLTSDQSNSSEDCLFLNVYVPRYAASAGQRLVRSEGRELVTYQLRHQRSDHFGTA